MAPFPYAGGSGAQVQSAYKLNFLEWSFHHMDLIFFLRFNILFAIPKKFSKSIFDVFSNYYDTLKWGSGPKKSVQICTFSTHKSHLSPILLQNLLSVHQNWEKMDIFL